MSLDQQFTEAINAQNALTQTVANKMTAIQEQVNAAIRAIPETYKRLYVSPGGNDNAVGSMSAPLQTIAAAIARVAHGSSAYIYLSSGDEHYVDGLIDCRNRFLCFGPWNLMTVKPSIVFKQYPHASLNLMICSALMVSGSVLTIDRIKIQTPLNTSDIPAYSTGCIAYGAASGTVILDQAELVLGDYSFCSQRYGYDALTLNLFRSSISLSSANNPRLVKYIATLRLGGSEVTLNQGLSWASNPATAKDLLEGVIWNGSHASNVLTNLF